MESATLSSCYADPNFAIICAFFEKFGKMCGVPFPMASELVGMLECEDNVSPELASLHTQLLRKMRRSTTVEKWERSAVKFCQMHLKDDADELDKNGYLGCSLALKLRLLRTLLESQFDYNPKFKAAVNLLTAEELRQKPIGKDLQGRLYWCHLDSGANMKIYREDPSDEENGWTVVANDRVTLVKLLHELTGDETLDLSPVIEPAAPVMDTGQDSSGSEEDEENGALSEGTSEEDDDDDDVAQKTVQPSELLKTEGVTDNKPEVNGSVDEIAPSEQVKEMETEPPFECSEAIEENVMYVNGVGSGAECDAGNPERNPEGPGEVSTTSERLADSSNDPRPSRREQPENSRTFEADSSENRVTLPDSTVNPERVVGSLSNHNVSDSSEVPDSTSENLAGSSNRRNHSRNVEPDSSRPFSEPSPSNLPRINPEESNLNSSSDARPTDRVMRLWSIHEICRPSGLEASTSSSSSNNATAENEANEAVSCPSPRPPAWTNSAGNVLPVPEIRVIPTTPEPERLPSPSSDPDSVGIEAVAEDAEEVLSPPAIDPLHVEGSENKPVEAENNSEITKEDNDNLNNPSENSRNNNVGESETEADSVPEIKINVENVNDGLVSPSDNTDNIVEENAVVPEVESPAEVKPEKPIELIEEEKIENSALSNNCESDNEMQVEVTQLPAVSNENTNCVDKETILKGDDPIPEPRENAVDNESDSKPVTSDIPNATAVDEKMDVDCVKNELGNESKTEEEDIILKAGNEGEIENDNKLAAIKPCDNQEPPTEEKPNIPEKPATEETDPLSALKTEDDPLAFGEDAPKPGPGRKSKKKKKRRYFQKKESDDGAENKAEDKESGTDNESPTKKEKRGSNYIPAREVQLLGIDEAILQDDGQPTVRQSRRIAQLRLKEDAERRRLEEIELENYKKRKDGGKRKGKKADSADGDDPYESDDSEDEDEKAHRRKEKKYKKFDDKNPWLNSTDSSSQEEEEDDDIEEEQEEIIVRSDHEFSPESDIDDPDYQPIRRARTAHARKEEPGPYDDVSCEFCGKSDRPEWILLCDKCDKGSHADCLKPPLQLVPEGEWFCPPCSLETLITGLKQTLRSFDRFERQRENEALRKKRLAFVGISLDNVLPTKKKDTKKPRPKNEASTSDESESESGSSGSRSEYSSESEPVYQLRERRSNVSSYRYNEYDEMIRSAIRDEEGEAPPELDTVKDEADDGNFVPSGEEENSMKREKKRIAEQEDEDSDEVPAVVPRKRQMKRKKKLTSLELSSEDDDHNSDSDFKGSSALEDEDEDFSETDLSDERKWRRGANNSIRRSERARRRRKDKDFINDDSTEVSGSEPDPSDSSDSDSDRSWRRKKKRKKSQKRRLPVTPSNKRKKKRRKLKGSDESDYEVRSRKRKSKQIESDSDGNVVNRRTRGKQIKFVDDASDSEESYSKKKKKGSSEESDEEFDADEVKDEEEQEEDDAAESEEEESDDVKPSKKNAKPVQKLSNQLKPKLKESDSEEDDLDGLDEEDEEKIMGLLDDSEMAVDDLKAAVKRTKEAKNKTEEKHKAKVIITPTRAEIAERAAMKTNEGILLQSLQTPSNATVLSEPAVLSVAQPFPMQAQVFQTQQGAVLQSPMQPILQPISLQNSHIALPITTQCSTPPQLVQHHLQIPVPPPGHQILQQSQIIPQLLSGVHQVVPTMTHPLGVSFAQQAPPMAMTVIQPQIHQTAIIAQPGMTISQMTPQQTTPLTQIPPTHLASLSSVSNAHIASKPFPPGAFPVQNYPNPSISPTMQLSPDPKQRKKPGPKPGSKNKKKEDDLPVNAASKSRPRARNGEDVTIATVQAPTQFPDGAAVESGSVITRMLNSSHGAVSVSEPGSHFPTPPVTTGPQIYQPARPMDPSPAGGAALNVGKPHFPPEGFSPYPNFQPHFAGFPSSTFPPTDTPLVSVGPPAPTPTLVPGGKPFDEEETSEFGGLASYFASQAEEDMDT